MTGHNALASGLRVGLVTSDLTHAHGWAHYSLSLLLALQRAGVEVTVIASRNSPNVPGVKVHKLLPALVPAERGLLAQQFRALPQAHALLQDCTVLHVTVEPFAPLGMMLAGRRPLHLTAHGSYVQMLPRRRWPVGWLYQRAFRRVRLVCVSHYTARVAQAVLPGLAPVVINNGVDIERFAHLPPLDMPNCGPTVLAVGAVKPRKGTLELVRAMAVVRQQVPDAQCIIIGSLYTMPDYAAQVQAAVVELGLQQNVHLLGHVPESTMLGWYGAADVFALPSMNSGDRFEGYGLVHMEASAAGLPVIGTRDCGAEDAVIHNETGLLISQTRITEELPQAIMALLADPARAAQMGTAGKAHAQQHTWDHVAERMIALYNAV